MILPAAAMLVAINLVAYAAMALDKSAARSGGWRWSERSLLALAAIGGSPAILLARHRLRHKTRKQPFAGILMAIAGLQLGAGVGWIATSVSAGLAG
jgi:uncharacterized membrane protein YsdA (DUF1294 family)